MFRSTEYLRIHARRIIIRKNILLVQIEILKVDILARSGIGRQCFDTIWQKLRNRNGKNVSPKLALNARQPTAKLMKLVLNASLNPWI